MLIVSYLLIICIVLLFFFSSRRRHTRCALVTGVQTCALPISMRLVPIYTEYYAVVSAMKAVAAENGAAEMQPGDIRNMLLKRFDVSYVSSVRPNDIRISRDRNPSIKIGRASCRERVCQSV